MRLVLGKILWNYDLEYAKGKPEWVAVQGSKTLPAWIVWHKPGLFVKLTPRA